MLYPIKGNYQNTLLPDLLSYLDIARNNNVDDCFFEWH